MRKVTVLLILLMVFPGGDGLFRSLYRSEWVSLPFKGDAGQPLFLTPYVEAGKIIQGRQLSVVAPFPRQRVESYAGFLTVNKSFNSNLFFWFFPAMVDSANAPVVLWLQGGPGGSSMFGLFVEHGPYFVTKNLTVRARDFPWSSTLSMLYIDNPVGTGFSFTDDPQGYAVNEDDVARDLFSALIQFFQLFPEYQKNDFYATGELCTSLVSFSGLSVCFLLPCLSTKYFKTEKRTLYWKRLEIESYAGKYVPAIAHYIHTLNPILSVKIKLKGIAIGDAYSDPESIIGGYAAFLYQIGLLDEKQRRHFQKLCDECVKYIKEEKWFQAFEVMDRLLDGDLTKDPSYFYNVTGCSNYYNILQCMEPEDQNYYEKFLSLSEVRRAIHVGNQTFNDGSKVAKYLREDTVKSVKPWLTEIMNNYKVLIYNGQLDIIVAAPLTEHSLMAMNWKGSREYKKAKRKIWKIFKSDAEVAGYVRQVGDFHQVIVRGGGHILPYDQPLRSFDMINRFIYDKGWDPY